MGHPCTPRRRPFLSLRLAARRSTSTDSVFCALHVDGFGFLPIPYSPQHVPLVAEQWRLRGQGNDAAVSVPACCRPPLSSWSTRLRPSPSAIGPACLPVLPPPKGELGRALLARTARPRQVSGRPPSQCSSATAASLVRASSTRRGRRRKRPCSSRKRCRLRQHRPSLTRSPLYRGARRRT